MNDEIHAARDVSKTNTTRLEAFGPKELGFLGYVDPDGTVAYYRRTEKRHSVDSEFNVLSTDVLPAVSIIYDYSGIGREAWAHLVDSPIKGLIVAAAGGGLAPPLREALARLVVDASLPVVISSRTGNGRVMGRPAYQEAGFVVADNLTPQKARVLLMVALLSTRKTPDLQRIFTVY
jgi:L-asparaginase/Glu-tRNA(Gln) amidotransferase subunit D